MIFLLLLTMNNSTSEAFIQSRRQLQATQGTVLFLRRRFGFLELKQVIFFPSWLEKKD